MIINKMLGIVNDLVKDLDGLYSLSPDIYNCLKDLQIECINKDRIKLQSEVLDNDYTISSYLDIQYNEDVDDFRITFDVRKYSKERTFRDQVYIQKIISCKYNELNNIISQLINSCFNFINCNENN
jgi:hypothetical protein